MDQIAIKYYEITKRYKHYPDEDLAHIRTPFGDEEMNVSEIALDFFDLINRDTRESTQRIKDIAEKQKKGADYLRTCILEAMLSDEPFIREMATLIYRHDKAVALKKKKVEDRKQREKDKIEVNAIKKKYKESKKEK